MGGAPEPVRGGAIPPSRDLPPFDRLVAIMRILRSPQGCPWDHKQTLQSLKEHLVEETYEVLDAIDSGDRAQLKEELGDLLLQVIFQSQLCAEEQSFTAQDVANGIAEKLIRRHPHVFGGRTVRDADDVLRNWEAIKKSEKGDAPRGTLDGVPKSLPALQKAHLVQRRVARVGFDWPDARGALAKLREEMGEVEEAASSGNPARVGEELGDLLFAAVNVCRFFDQHPEHALQATVNRFSNRFRYIEEQVRATGRSLDELTLDEMDQHWSAAKARGL